MRRPRAAITAAVLLGLASQATAQELPPTGPDTGVYEGVWRFIRDRFYDRTMHGVNWEEARKRHEADLKEARDQEGVHRVIMQMLAELHASHTQIAEPDVYQRIYNSEAKPILAPRYGIRLVRLPAGYFVAEVTPGTPAAAAGVLRGDRLLSVDGEPPERARLRPLPYDAGITDERGFLIPTLQPGDRVQLELQRDPDPLSTYEVSLVSMGWNNQQACRMSRRVYRKWGFKVGYIRLYNLLSTDSAAYLTEFLLGELADADAVIVDLRGYGGLEVLVTQVLAMFDPNAQGGPLWDRLAVALIDHHARSAKELLAWEWKTRKIGPLVGTNTAGAVLGAAFQALDDGSSLLFPYMDMRSCTGGVSLEGVGVAPDYAAQVEIPYVHGTDQVLEKGLEVTFDELLAIQQARSKRGGWR